MTNKVHGLADDVRACCSCAQLPIFEALYALIRKHAGDCQEIAWPKQAILSFGVGPKKMSQHHCYIAVYAEHLNLGFYHGATLPDPDALLEGTGKSLRHIKVKSVDATRSPAMTQLVRLAVADRVKYGGTAK
jgi:hypothetical protein